MKNTQTDYRILSTKECITYIEKHGLTIYDDNYQYKLKSMSGLIYLLPNSEVILIPTNFDLNYPGIIFKNIEVFKYYSKLDFFPIKEENMTWFERHNRQIKDFRTEREFYRDVLSNFHITFPFKDGNDIENAFIKIRSYIHYEKKSFGTVEIEDLIYSFGLEIINYYVDNQDNNFEFRYGHENYNPTTEVLLLRNNKIVSILTICAIYCYSTSDDSSMFMYSISH